MRCREADLDCGGAVVRVADLGAPPAQRVDLVEEQDRVAGLRALEDPGRRFFSVSPTYVLTAADRSIQ
jgi:hypothetical protein